MINKEKTFKLFAKKHTLSLALKKTFLLALILILASCSSSSKDSGKSDFALLFSPRDKKIINTSKSFIVNYDKSGKELDSHSFASKGYNHLEILDKSIITSNLESSVVLKDGKLSQNKTETIGESSRNTTIKYKNKIYFIKTGTASSDKDKEISLLTDLDNSFLIELDGFIESSVEHDGKLYAILSTSREYDEENNAEYYNYNIVKIDLDRKIIDKSTSIKLNKNQMLAYSKAASTDDGILIPLITGKFDSKDILSSEILYIPFELENTKIFETKDKDDKAISFTKFSKLSFGYNNALHLISDDGQMYRIKKLENSLGFDETKIKLNLEENAIYLLYTDKNKLYISEMPKITTIDLDKEKIEKTITLEISDKFKDLDIKSFVKY